MALRTNFSDSFLDDALPALEALIFDEYMKQPDIVPQLFQMKDSARWGEQTSTFSGLRPASSKSEGVAVSFDDPIQGFDKTYSHLTYALAVAFSQEVIEDDKMSLVEATYRALGLSMYQTRQIVSMNIFNDGFGDTGPDGVSLFHASHPLIGGSTYGNRPSTDVAMSVAGLRVMEIQMMKQVNHRGINVVNLPRKIMGPPDLKHVMMELIKSQDRPDTPNRAINTFFMENYQPLVSPYLSSTTAWFALADVSQTQLRFYDRVAPAVESWPDPKTGEMNSKIRCRFSVGYSEWMGAWGTTG